jgi:hypothetical protein
VAGESSNIASESFQYPHHSAQRGAIKIGTHGDPPSLLQHRTTSTAQPPVPLFALLIVRRSSTLTKRLAATSWLSAPSRHPARLRRSVLVAKPSCRQNSAPVNPLLSNFALSRFTSSRLRRCRTANSCTSFIPLLQQRNPVPKQVGLVRRLLSGNGFPCRRLSPLEVLRQTSGRADGQASVFRFTFARPNPGTAIAVLST